MARLIKSNDVTLESSLKNFKSVSKRLNEVTNKINSTFSIVEKYLDECSIGIYAGVPFITDRIPLDPEFEYFLEYTKSSGKYRIVLGKYYHGDFEGGTTQPWEELPRPIKIEVIKLLPQLLNLLTEKVNDLLDQIDDAEFAITEVAGILKGDI